MKLLHQAGDVINQKYRILDILGKGGIGITYLAQNLESCEKLALKCLSLRQMNDWKKIELFEREGQILSQLNHPAIPSYFDYFKIETDKDYSFYIAQQLAPGKSLEKLIESGWNPDESAVKDIAIQILDILIYLHSFSPPIIHRDIKPQNIICDENGRVFLVDFGAVTDTYHNTVTKGSTVVGTFGYMAPEQFRGKAFPSTDLYGLGTTLLYLLTKKCPSDLPQKHLKIDFRSQVNISRNFINWLDKVLEPAVENRFPDVKIALVVLEGKESIDKYLLQKSRKPKDTPINFSKNQEKLQIDIPAGKFRNNLALFYSILFFFGNGLLFFIFLAAFQYSSFSNTGPILAILILVFPCLIIGFTKISYFLLNPLSRIKLTILKKNNYHIFGCQKWLFSLRYRNYQKYYSFGTKLHKTQFRDLLNSVELSLTPQEYRWLQAEIDNFINNNISYH